MGRSTVHYADNKTNNALKALHNKLRPAGTPVQRVEYIIELLLLRIFETKIKQDEEFKPLRNLFSADYKWLNPKSGKEESNENRLFSYLPTVSNDQILSELNDNFFPFYSTILQSARKVFERNLPQKVQDQLVLIEEVFNNSNFTNNVNSGNLGEVISIVANDIEEARLLKTDLLGDAIESALSETGGTKDIGLFRTPDHVRQFMTAIIEPTFDDMIFDPACGTGGFLFDAFEFVMRRVDPDREWPGEKAHSELKEWFYEYFKSNQIEFPSIEQSTQFYRSGVTGIEYLGVIRKMAAINFYIRGLNPANIEQGDSLAKYKPVTDHESKSVVLANPPFGAQRDQEAYPDVWGEYSKESETTILFVKLMFEHLKQGGRCAVVVSEGFHTWDQFSAKTLRKMLLEEAQLKAAISLPQGLFVSKNGQGPKTSILVFEKGGKTDWTWFYKVTNDGYSMGTNRKEQKGNQLTECLTLWHEFVKHGIQPPESKNQFCIPAEWIKTLDPRIKEKIRTETRADMEEKGAIERTKKAEELDKKIKAKKATEADRQMELKLFDQMLENRIQNEIAKRIDKAHNYSFNLANYKSTFSENQLAEWSEALSHIQPKLRTIVTKVLRPRFLYACSAERILFYDNAWRGLDAGEFKQVNSFMTLEEMKLKAEQQKKIDTNREIIIDTTIAGGYDPTIGKERYYQLQCIRTIVDNYKAGKQKMLIHMATGLGKTRTAVALVKTLLECGLSKRILFVVDRRMLAKQAIEDGFSLISGKYTSSWITTSNFRTRKHASIHVVVIDTLELIYSDLSSNFYDLIIVDECHRSINVNRKLIFDHFLCPRVGLTATPRIAAPKDGAAVDEEDLAIIDTYKLFGCETGEPDFGFDIARGINEGFLAPYKPIELISYLVEEAQENGIDFDHVLEPNEKYVIQLGEEKKLKLEQLNRKFISDENCMRIAEELKKNTQYGEKVILFGVSQAHCIELAKAINKVFQNDNSEKPYYAETVISENNELNETLKAWFKKPYQKPYQKPYIAVSVDILSTGVDIPCVRYVALAALTKSVGKYIQMVGRGTRLDPKTGKFSFQVLDFVGLCKRMEDNGKGTAKENTKVVKPGGQITTSGGTTNPKGEYFLIDNPDPANLIQRVEIHGDSIVVKDNIPIEEAKRIFEEELKNSDEPIVVDLKEKAKQPEYQPTDEEIERFIKWLSMPNTFLDEGHLQKMYDYPQGTAWDFLLHAIGKKKIPTPKERIEKNYLSYIHTYNFTDEQIVILKKIKDVFASNIASKRDIDVRDIFGNPIYESLIGTYDSINSKFDGKFELVINDLKDTFGARVAS